MTDATREQKATLEQVKVAFKLGDTQTSYLENVAWNPRSWVWGTPSQDRRLREGLINKGLVVESRYEVKLSELAERVLNREIPAAQGWELHLAAVKANKVAELRAEASRLMDQVIDLSRRADELEGKK